MSSKSIYDTIREAIQTKQEVILEVKHGAGGTIPNTYFQAYILGSDTYQYDFVWGSLGSDGLYYKFLLDNIISAKSTNIKYTVSSEACYQHALEEEHYQRIEGFANVYSQGAKNAR